MRQLYYILLVLITMTVLVGCKKDEPDQCLARCTTVQGHFLTGNGQEPLRGLSLQVVWFKSYGFFGRTDVRIKDKAITDENGNYTLRYMLTDEEVQTGYMDVDVSSNPTYYGLNGVYLPAPQQRDTTVVAPTYWLPRPALLEFTLQNPADMMQTSDRISINIDFKPGPGRNGYNGSIGGFASPALTGSTATTAMDVPAEQLLRIKVLRFRSSNMPFSVTRDSLLLRRGEKRAYPVRF